MAYPNPNTITVQAPTSKRVAEIRLLYSMASGAFEGFTSDEARQFEMAKNIADPRYGNNPEGAVNFLIEHGWEVFGALRKRTMTTIETANHLGVTVRRVQALIENGQLTAEKHGRDYVLFYSDVEEFAQKERPSHRPTRSKVGEN